MHTGLEELPDGAAAGGLYAERARHGVALIVTGGIAPAPLASPWPAARCSTMPAIWRTIAILPTRYIRKAAKSLCRSCTPAVTATSPRWWPLGATGADQPFYPHELSHDEILTLIDDFAHCAQLAREAAMTASR